MRSQIHPSNQKDQQHSHSSSFPHLNDPHLKALADCITACKACSKMCIEEGNKKTAILCEECAEVCELAFKFVSTDSCWCNQTLELCKAVCTKCAEECNKMSAQHCKDCANICRECADCCQSTHSVSH